MPSLNAFSQSLLDAIKSAGLQHTTRVYQASSSEMFGDVAETPQTERTPFRPRSPYAIAKLFAFWSVVNYREAYGLHASNGILFNHESPRRGRTFVTRKISRGVAAIKLGLQKRLYLGNLDAKRDWGDAKDYVRMMWLMLQQEKADDFVISSGETHSVREFVEKAFLVVGISIIWSGSGFDEVGLNSTTNEAVVVIKEKYFRPSEVDFLLGCSDKAKHLLGWDYSFSFEDLVREMVESDLEALLTNKNDF